MRTLAAGLVFSLGSAGLLAQPAPRPARAPATRAAPAPAPVGWYELGGHLIGLSRDVADLKERELMVLEAAGGRLDEYWIKEGLDFSAPVIAGLTDKFGLEDARRRLSLAEPGWSGRDNPEDSLYRLAREVLNRGEYRKAAEQLAGFAQRYPQSRYRPAALYWRAFALYRAGTETDLRTALGLLDDLAKQTSAVANDPEVSALLTRVVGTLAARGDQAAASRLKQGAARGESSCDREDVEVRAEALSALVQNDPTGSTALLTRILGRRDECSVPLRRRAVYLLGKDGNQPHADEVLEVAKNDPSREVRIDAISRLAQIPGDRSTATLEQFLAAGIEESVQRAVIRALQGREDEAAARLVRRLIEREEGSESLRAEAIRGMACCGREAYYVPTTTSGPGTPKISTRRTATLSDADVALLRGVYDKTASRMVKSAVVETMSRAAGPATDAWLMGLIRNPAEDLRFRSAALGRLRNSETPIEDLTRLYDGLNERELRASLVDVLGQREEPAATDKLIEIAKTGTDPVIRRMAVAALARKKDPRTTKLLLDMVEKS